jgi:hypothetical protein
MDLCGFYMAQANPIPGNSSKPGFASMAMVKLKGEASEGHAKKGGESAAIKVDAPTRKILSKDSACD